MKKDSLTRFLAAADSHLLIMRKAYSIRKTEIDSIRAEAAKNPKLRIAQINDSTENDSMYRVLVIEEIRIIDSILTEQLRDTIQVYVNQFAKLEKYQRVIERSQLATLPIQGADYETLDVTQDLIAFMRKKRKQ